MLLFWLLGVLLLLAVFCFGVLLLCCCVVGVVFEYCNAVLWCRMDVLLCFGMMRLCFVGCAAVLGALPLSLCLLCRVLLRC